MMRWLVASVVLSAAAAGAQPSPGSCCAQSTSYLDALLNPTRGSDEAFFTKSAGRPTIHLVLDTSCSMADWPQTWPTTRGCAHTDFAQGYDPAVAYPKMWANWGGTIPNWFDVTRFYEVPAGGYSAQCQSPASGPNCLWGSVPYTPNYDNAPGGFVDDSPSSQHAAQTFSRTLPSGWTLSSPVSSLTTNNDACYLSAGAQNSDRDACRTCLATRGYYVYDQYTRRVTGNFLNFFGPRDSSSAAVLTQLVHDLPEVRMLVSAFSMSSRDSCWRVGLDGVGRICMFSKNNRAPPTCGLSDLTARTRNQHELLMDALRRELTYTSGTPLTEALYAAGHSFRSKTPDAFLSLFGAGYPTSRAFDEDVNASGDKSLCSGCGLNAIIVLTDGEPNGRFTSMPGAIASESVTCQGTTCTSEGLNSAKVAKFWWEHDLRADYTGQQRVATYTIGFSNDASQSDNLRTIAWYGGGKFFPAENSAQLKAALTAIVDDVVARNNAFSAAAISSVQTPGAGLTAIVPRMKPQQDGFWYGTLHRFAQFNEFVEDTNFNAATGDTDKNDVFVVDADGAIVTEDSDGNFVKQGTGGAAKPYWEASSGLVSLGWQNRRIFTVVDSDRDGAFTQHDRVVSFSEDNLAQLTDSFGVVGSAYCPKHGGDRGELLAALKLTVSEAASLLGVPASTQGDLDRLCVRALMDFVRGRDLGDADGDANRSETRPRPLGDVFHSSPVVVNPPVEKSYCQLGLDPQCLPTLFTAYSGVAPTPLTDGHTASERGCYDAPPSLDAYDAWVFAQRKRDRVVLVGANDGMLHAFHDGEQAETCTLGQSTVVAPPLSGTGEELWAFIPPDLLPRLRQLPAGHAYMVDGDVMVRDIWADENRDGEKQPAEFHTMAVVANGRGGTHYWALEVRFDTAGNPVTPGFRWLFPQPCSAEAASFGKTLLQLSPKPPPIGPVLLERDSLPPSEQPTTGAPRVTCTGGASCDSVERWVVMVGGGWSPALERGRGVYLLDVWNGKVNGRGDNLLWKWEYDPSARDARTGSQRFLTHSVVAPVAMADVGDGEVFRRDGFFDTAVVGDTIGQLWTFRFAKPGRFNSGTGLIDNWAGARGFDQDRDDQTTGNDDDGTGTNERSLSRRGPIHVMTSLAVQTETNALRAFVGTGNRYSLLDQGPGTCRFDNLEACARRGCSSARFETSLKRINASYARVGSAWKDRTFRRAIATDTGVAASACGAPGDLSSQPPYELTVRTSALRGCPGVTDQALRDGRFACGQDADGHFRCERTDSATWNLGDLDVTTSSSTLNSLSPNRTFGVWLFGGRDERRFEEDATTGALSASSFDDRRLTDRTSSNPTGGDLVDVTTTTCTTSGCTGPQATDTGWGWVIDYVTDSGAKDLSTRTATGAAVVASCTLWTALRPAVSTGTSAAGCGQVSPAEALSAQADYVTGAPNCAIGFATNGVYARTARRNVLAPPPEPATAVQLSKTGEVRYSTMVLEPGSTQAQETQVSSGNDLLQSIYELPLSREAHQCRHTGNGPADCYPAP